MDGMDVGIIAHRRGKIAVHKYGMKIDVEKGSFLIV